VSLELPIPEELVEEIAARAAEIVLQRVRGELGERSSWLAGAKQAASHLGWPVARVYRHLTEIPHYRHGNRLMFRTDELDAWVEGQRERLRSD
jgi:hypothetical protein